ncbi:PREDICTED: neuropeptide B [Elephantulus edwardii]|uniref:neuropeptide B n=1 Tax=Elephantulus edwardii TaxID=28737 RepID=UPI0003F06E58|nr:PREDICTED: neuropeptide B [Elephantulus edwardii]
MARSEILVAALALALLLASHGHAWYKPAAGLSYYSVGRAAGLLSGFRRSPFMRRAQLPRGFESPGIRPSLQGLALCVRHVTPSLQGCARLPDSTFQCKADVVLSLRTSDCQRA